MPESDVFYTLNVLLGLARVRSVPSSIDLSGTFQRNASDLVTLPVPKYAFGIALWAAGELGLELPGHVLRHIDVMLSNKNNWRSFRAQDLGMILVGVATQAKRDPKKMDSTRSRSIRVFGRPISFAIRIFLRRGFRSATTLCLFCHPDLPDARLLLLW